MHLGLRNKEIAAAINPKTRRVKVKLLSKKAMKVAISHLSIDLFAGPSLLCGHTPQNTQLCLITVSDM
jgi:hypothetical protein